MAQWCHDPNRVATGFRNVHRPFAPRLGPEQNLLLIAAVKCFPGHLEQPQVQMARWWIRGSDGSQSRNLPSPFVLVNAGWCAGAGLILTAVKCC